jgi:hypothetical protein
MAERIEVTRKTEFSFDGRAGSVQTVILNERIPTPGVVSGVLAVRIHNHSGLTNTALAKIQVINQAVSRDDPGVLLVQSTAGGAEVASVTITQATAQPDLLVDPLTAPIASMVRVLLEWSQGATPAADAQKIVIGVDLVGRAAG